MMEHAPTGKSSTAEGCDAFISRYCYKEGNNSQKEERIPLIIVCVRSNGAGKEVKAQFVSNIFHEHFLFRWTLSAGPEL